MKKKSEAVKLNNYFRMAKRMQALVTDENIENVKEAFLSQFKGIYEKTSALILLTQKRGLLPSVLDIKQLTINY